MFLLDYISFKKKTVRDTVNETQRQKIENNNNGQININRLDSDKLSYETSKNEPLFDEISSNIDDNSGSKNTITNDSDFMREQTISDSEYKNQFGSESIRFNRVLGNLDSSSKKEYRDEFVDNNDNDIESQKTFKSTNSDKQTTKFSKVPHQIRYTNRNSLDINRMKINNENLNKKLHNKILDSIVDGEYQRRENYISEQHEGWQPILTNC